MIKLETRPLKDVPIGGLFLSEDAAWGLHLLRKKISTDTSCYAFTVDELHRWIGFFDTGKIYAVASRAKVAYMGVILNEY